MSGVESYEGTPRSQGYIEAKEEVRKDIEQSLYGIICETVGVKDLKRQRPRQPQILDPEIAKKAGTVKYKTKYLIKPSKEDNRRHQEYMHGNLKNYFERRTVSPKDP